jgi:alkyl hydroperoxide reductase subunit AhpF
MQSHFDAESWADLPAMLAHLPEPVRLVVWGDSQGLPAELEATRLARTLAERFPTISLNEQPRRANYPYYPVIGVMGLGPEGELDLGLRIIGLPAGYQFTSLVAAIQAVAFRGMTLEARTRIALHRLQQPVIIEVIAAAEVEEAALMAKVGFSMAAASPHVRCHLIMGDAFPEALIRYSVQRLPHTVVGGRIHLAGVVDEATLLRHVAAAQRP